MGRELRGRDGAVCTLRARRAGIWHSAHSKEGALAYTDLRPTGPSASTRNCIEPYRNQGVGAGCPSLPSKACQSNQKSRSLTHGKQKALKEPLCADSQRSSVIRDTVPVLVRSWRSRVPGVSVPGPALMFRVRDPCRHAKWGGSAEVNTVEARPLVPPLPPRELRRAATVPACFLLRKSKDVALKERPA